MTDRDDDPVPDSREIITLPPRVWQKGGPSPNPGGRPRRERECAAILDHWLPEIMATLARKAVEGDVSAAQILVQAGLPPARTAIAQLDLGAMRTSHGCQLALSRVSTAVATGVLSPRDAAPFLTLIAAATKQIELGEIAEKIAAIERLLAAGERPRDGDDDPAPANARRYQA